MKRSEVNALLEDAKEFFASRGFMLPPWAYWSVDEWGGRDDLSEIKQAALGWDVTDFDSGEFAKRGLLLFTVRNGEPTEGGEASVPVYAKTYAEKIMIVGESQETPFHFHWNKVEDIINRGGGNLVVELYLAHREEEFSDEEVTVSIDGIPKRVAAGGRIVLHPGESVTLYPRLYHRFYGEPGRGRVLVGEVSSVNDDGADNRFKEPFNRYPTIEEDQPPLHLLVSDYRTYL